MRKREGQWKTQKDAVNEGINVCERVTDMGHMIMSGLQMSLNDIKICTWSLLRYFVIKACVEDKFFLSLIFFAKIRF